MAKKIFYDDDARARVLGGAKALYDAVKVTMGPKGRNVVIGKSYGHPTVTHDGVSVAKAVELPEDTDENLGYKVGAELIKQAANKMNDVAGDGTTTVTVLTYSILAEANRLIAAGHNPMELRRGVEAAGADVLNKLADLREDIGAKQDRVAEVATISAGDAQIGKLIADVIAKVGKDGVVTVEEGQGLHLESEVVEGFTMDRGYVSPYMVTDPARMEAVYEKPAIVVTDQKVGSIQEFLPLLEKLAQAGKKDLVLIAEDVDGEAMTTFILNKLKGVFNTVAVKAPAFGDRRKETLQDIAILTGATVISPEQGITFENADLGMVGTARKVIVTKDNTTIIEGAGAARELADRIKQIRAQADSANSEYDKEQYEKRAAALGGKVAVIKVGGASEVEIEEAKFRVDDAVAATKAALDEGIVPGGGVSFVYLSFQLTPATWHKGDVAGADTRLAGYGVLKKALQQPFMQLMTNAGFDASVKLNAVVEEIAKLSKSGKNLKGYDLTNPDELVELKKAGIIDPARVTKEAIQNAVSIAATALTMGALIVDIPEKEAPAPGGGGMPGMGMM
jgi:chaperonin GroEL